MLHPFFLASLASSEKSGNWTSWSLRSPSMSEAACVFQERAIPVFPDHCVMCFQYTAPPQQELKIVSLHLHVRTLWRPLQRECGRGTLPDSWRWVIHLAQLAPALTLWGCLEPGHHCCKEAQSSWMWRDHTEMLVGRGTESISLKSATTAKHISERVKWPSLESEPSNRGLRLHVAKSRHQHWMISVSRPKKDVK